jgi:hypothetical protein
MAHIEKLWKGGAEVLGGRRFEKKTKHQNEVQLRRGELRW